MVRATWVTRRASPLTRSAGKDLACLLGLALLIFASPTPARQSTTGLVTQLTMGDVACYVMYETSSGAKREEKAESGVCLLDLVGRKVKFARAPIRILAPSCQGNPDCPETVIATLITAATVLDPDAPKSLPATAPEGLSGIQAAYDAAARGSADAQYRLGSAFELGQGVDRDYAIALKWYRAAAEQASGAPSDGPVVRAQSSIGRLYARGHGVGRNLPRAYMWMTLASDGGNKVARDNLGKIEAGMRAEDVHEGRALAAQCRARNFVKCE